MGDQYISSYVTQLLYYRAWVLWVLSYLAISKTFDYNTLSKPQKLEPIHQLHKSDTKFLL